MIITIDDNNKAELVKIFSSILSFGAKITPTILIVENMMYKMQMQIIVISFPFGAILFAVSNDAMSEITMMIILLTKYDIEFGFISAYLFIIGSIINPKTKSVTMNAVKEQGTSSIHLNMLFVLVFISLHLFIPS